MYYYRIYGLDVCSDLEMPMLVSIYESDVREEYKIEVKEGELPEKQAAAKSNCGFDRNEGYVRNNYGTLYVKGGNLICYDLKAPAYLQAFIGFILGWAFSMILHQRGMLAIHCSCIGTGSGAVLISGRSGAGKSTVTSRLLCKGFRLMADDIAAVQAEPGKILAYPAFPYQKLCRDVAQEQDEPLEKLLYINEKKDKFLMPYKGDFSCEPEPLKALVLLEANEDEEFSIRELKGVERWNRCMDSLFISPLLGRNLSDPFFAIPTLTLASTVKIVCISRGVQGDYRQQVADAVMNIISK
ncbi:MAG: hypothetical protein IKS11_07770 [Lachnospiraceae bacterium]|nr:hypothetical protein [Lachnospiraceae bacterium]